MPMTKLELQAALKAVAAEMEGWTRYERGVDVTLPVKRVDKVRARVYELSEETVLWT